MSTVIQETTAAVRPTVIEDIRWNVGCRTSRIGDYLVKLGDRIHGDRPMGLAEVYELGHAMGKRKPDHRDDRPRAASRAYAQRLTAHNGGAAMPARPRQHDDGRDTMTTPSQPERAPVGSLRRHRK